jgi:hypothetical protein
LLLFLFILFRRDTKYFELDDDGLLSFTLFLLVVGWLVG